jgi:hypothetical protein
MPESYTRILQVTVPRDTLILLQKILLKWTERDLPPAKVSKSQVVIEALRLLAVREGVLPGSPTNGSSDSAVAQEGTV